MRTIPYITDDTITDKISGLNERYAGLFYDLGVKGPVLLIKENEAIRMILNSKYKIVATVRIAEIVPNEKTLKTSLDNELSYYLKNTNGNAFVIANPLKEKWFLGSMEKEGHKAENFKDIFAYSE